MFKSVTSDGSGYDLFSSKEADGLDFSDLLAQQRQKASDSIGSGIAPASSGPYRGGPYTPSQARYLARLIEEYRKLPPEERNGGEAELALKGLRDLGVNTPDALLLMPPQPEFLANLLGMNMPKIAGAEGWTKETIKEHLDRLDPPIKLPPDFWDVSLENNFLVLGDIAKANGPGMEAPLRPEPEPEPSPLQGMETASGEAIVEKLESLGYYTFSGDRAQELRDGVIECINKSPFFKRSLIDSFELSADNSRMNFKFEDLEIANGQYIPADNGISLDVDQEGQSLLYTLAHEMFHGFSVRDDIDVGIRDAADMVQSMDVFVAESGIPEASMAGAGPVTSPSVDYDLYRATLDDWHDAKALRQEDYYDNSKPELKDAMERIFGRSGRGYDPNQAFSDSCQKFDGDRDRIIQAYIDAKDGGKVEALRAEQLRELGIDPEGLKNVTELADWYTDNISIDRREVASIDNAFPKEKIIELSDFYRNNINENATEVEISDWVMGQLEFRVESGFNGDGAEAREILHNNYVKHGGRETMAGFVGDFDTTLNKAVDIYANGGIDTETRALFGFNQGDGPIKPLFQEMVRFYVTNINPEATAEDAGLWVAEQIEGRLGNATGQDEEKLEIYGNYVNKPDRDGREDAIDVATEVFHELELDPLPEPAMY